VAGINLFSSAVQAPATGGTFNARFVNNRIGVAGTSCSGSSLGNGLRVNINGGADATVLIDSNVIREAPNGRGIEIISRNGTNGLDVTLTSNQVNNDFVTTPENQGFSLASLFVQSNCVTVCNTLRADIRSNTVPATPPNGELLAAQLALIETGASTLQLVDNAAASANCTAELTSQNTGSASANAGCSLTRGPSASRRPNAIRSHRATASVAHRQRSSRRSHRTRLSHTCRTRRPVTSFFTTSRAARFARRRHPAAGARFARLLAGAATATAHQQGVGG
jgi:hypothetical protein